MLLLQLHRLHLFSFKMCMLISLFDCFEEFAFASPISLVISCHLWIFKIRFAMVGGKLHLIVGNFEFTIVTITIEMLPLLKVAEVEISGLKMILLNE